MNILVGWWGWGFSTCAGGSKKCTWGLGGELLGFREPLSPSHTLQISLHTQGPVSLPTSSGILGIACITFPSLMGIKFLRARFYFFYT